MSYVPRYGIESRCKTHLLDRNFSKIKVLLPPEICTVDISGGQISPKCLLFGRKSLQITARARSSKLSCRPSGMVLWSRNRLLGYLWVPGCRKASTNHIMPPPGTHIRKKPKCVENVNIFKMLISEISTVEISKVLPAEISTQFLKIFRDLFPKFFSAHLDQYFDFSCKNKKSAQNRKVSDRNLRSDS